MLSEVAEDRGRVIRGSLWGVFLIAVGVTFLLERAGLIDSSLISSLWPAVFGFVALGQLLDGRPGAATTSALLGAWFFACKFGWYGLTYRNSWGLTLVAFGAGTVVRALSGEDARTWRRMSRRMNKPNPGGEGRS